MIINMKKRVGYYDIAKGIGIILVVIAHIEYMPLELRKYIVTFHMPAFFVISGMLMNLTGEAGRPFKPLLLNKIQRIMIPYFVFSLVYPLIEWVRFLVTGDGYSAEHFWQDIFVGITMTGVSVLWFLPALFFSELLVLFIVRHYKKPVYLIAYVLILALLWCLPFLIQPMALVLWRIVICSFLVLAGYLLYPMIKKGAGYPVILLPAAVFMFVILYFTGELNGIVDLHYVLLGNKALYYLNALMGSVALVFLSIFTEERLGGMPERVLTFFGRHSLFIMITHINFFVLYLGEKIAFAASNATSRAKDPIFNIVATVVTLTIEALMILVWEKLKMCGILFIGNRRIKV